jgi:hypothetical protein
MPRDWLPALYVSIGAVLTTSEQTILCIRRVFDEPFGRRFGLFIDVGQIELGVSQGREECVGSTGRLWRKVPLLAPELAVWLIFVFGFRAVVLLLLLLVFVVTMARPPLLCLHLVASGTLF